MTGGRRPALPAGVPDHPALPEGDFWWEDTDVASRYWLARAIWRAQLRDAALTPAELAVLLAARQRD
ncbi:hypothetical protein ACGF1Z_31290 [Streptomyces sp. NPDC048018]|uniref:hypothetical protein n=1 Tax=Streptomyces sp. NPDC048018 TaxID=3365499 RepID=UPI00371A6EBD